MDRSDRNPEDFRDLGSREVLEARDDFKFNVALVIIDFLIRRGVIGPERPDYPALAHGLRLAV